MANELVTKLNTILNEKVNKIVPENIKKDVTIFDVIGTLEAGIDTSDATATAEDIALNKTAYANGKKITGTLISSEDLNTELNAQDEIIIQQQTKIDELLHILNTKGSSSDGLPYNELFSIANSIYDTGIPDDSDTVDFTVDDEEICLQRALKIYNGGI